MVCVSFAFGIAGTGWATSVYPCENRGKTHSGVMLWSRKARMGVNQRLVEKRDQILQIAERHGAYNVRVFGSVARGEAGPESDVDSWSM